MDADGSNQTNITNYWKSDIQPSWSPDGTRIAFASKRDIMNEDIYVMMPTVQSDPADHSSRQ